MFERTTAAQAHKESEWAFKIIFSDFLKVVNLVETILSAKKAAPSADTSAPEAKLDALVYQLYGLTENEIAVVEGRAALSSADAPA